jgi:hypothetical protein
LDIVKQLCDYAAANEWSVDSKAAFHLHVGVAEDAKASLAAMALGYLITRKLWGAFVASSRVNSKYCLPHTTAVAGLFKKKPQDILDRLTKNEARFRWINWQSYALHTTLEVRLHQGTLLYEKIANWVKAHTRFIDWCSSGERPCRRVWRELGSRRGSGKVMLEFLGEEVWKDPGLAAWFAGRAKQLKHGMAIVQGAPTCDSNEFQLVAADGAIRDPIIP